MQEGQAYPGKQEGYLSFRVMNPMEMGAMEYVNVSVAIVVILEILIAKFLSCSTIWLHSAPFCNCICTPLQNNQESLESLGNVCIN